MEKIVRDLIEYNGISIYTYSVKNFKQFNIEQIDNISNKRADMDQILKVWVDTKVIDTEVIKTPIGSSTEGQIATGKKLIVCGDIDIKIEYVSCDDGQNIYVENFTIPFGTYVVLPQKFNEHGIISATIMVEDISSTIINPRCIYNNITLIAIADIY
ncbi:MAG: hypothetical protein RSG52_13155 [Terrisporobacter sp.]|uniref:SPOCS domain-containing protein n=1 Tax=Terrisporobacter sp. TaxID=1965305 RepID=UPI002FC8D23A